MYLKVLDSIIPSCKRILELGSFRGNSTKILVEKTEHLDCVDKNFLPQFRKRFKKDKRITRFEGLTKDILPKLEEGYDVVFVDAGHIYNEVKFDLTESLRLLKPDGLLIGDDMNSYIKEPDWKLFYANKNKYGIKIPGILGTVYCGIFCAVKEIIKFPINRKENLFYGTYPG